MALRVVFGWHCSIANISRLIRTDGRKASIATARDRLLVNLKMVELRVLTECRQKENQFQSNRNGNYSGGVSVFYELNRNRSHCVSYSICVRVMGICFEFVVLFQYRG